MTEVHESEGRDHPELQAAASDPLVLNYFYGARRPVSGPAQQFSPHAKGVLGIRGTAEGMERRM